MFNFQLCALTYLNTDTPSIHGFPSFNSTIIIFTAYITLHQSSCPTLMPSSLSSNILGLRNGNPHQTQLYPQVETIDSITPVYLTTSSAPSWQFLLILSLLLWYPLWFPSLLHLHPMILPLLPLFLLTHYFLHVYDPKTISLERGHHRSQEGNVLYQGRRLG